MSDERKAINLTAADLDRWVTVRDWRGDEHHGRLDAIEMWADKRTRVVLRISKQEPINESDGGGFYWASFMNERHVNRDAVVTIGELVGGDHA